jgi:carbonic anhydrase
MLEEPMELSRSQIAAFQKLFPGNHRDVDSSRCKERAACLKTGHRPSRMLKG